MYFDVPVENLIAHLTRFHSGQDDEITLVLGDGKTITLAHDQADQLLGQLKDAEGIIVYLKPKFDAFNSVKPDASAPDVLGDNLILNAK